MENVLSRTIGRDNMKYKSLKLYREKAYESRDETKPSIEDNLYVLSEDTAKQVVAYLESGYLLLTFVSPVLDLYDQKTSLPWEIYTDGVYMWDSIIIHWVKTYRVRLPEAFLHHALTHQRMSDIEIKALGGITAMGKNTEQIWIDS